MSPILFADAISKGRTIDVFNHGKSRRDFTFVEDIVEGLVRVMDHIPRPDPAFDRNNPSAATSWAPFRVFNIGNHDAIPVLRFIEVLEAALGKKARMNLKPMEPGDVEATYADTEALSAEVGFAPHTPIEQGVAAFVAWYREYYRA